MLSELKKLLFKQHILIIALGIILLKIIFLIPANYQNIFDTGDELKCYSELINQLSGPLNDQKVALLGDLKNERQEYKDKLDSLSQQFERMEITEAQYITMTQQLTQPTISENVYSYIMNQYEYVKGDPNERYFLADFQWKSHLSNSFDTLLALFVIVTSVMAFAYEYENHSRYFILTTPAGQRKFVFLKILSIYIIAIGMGILSILINIIFDGSALHSAEVFYPLQSVSDFENSIYQMSILKNYIVLNLLRLIGLWCLSSSTVIVTVLIKNTLPALFISFCYSIIPLYLFKGHMLYLLPHPTPFMMGKGYFVGESVGLPAVSQYSLLVVLAYHIFVIFAGSIFVILFFSARNQKLKDA